MKKFKVLHIFSSYTIGGAEKMTVAIARDLNNLSTDFESLVGAPKDSYIYQQSLKENLKVYDFICRGSFTPTGVFRLFNIIKKEKIDILHIHQGKLYWTGLLMKLFFKKLKVVLHRRQDTRHKWYARLHYKFADMTLTVSKMVLNNLIKYEHAPEKKLKVLYNGFDFETFAKDTNCTDLTEQYNLKDKFVIGTVGAIVSLDAKGQKYLIEAVSELRKKYNNLAVLIVGSGPGKTDLENYAKQFNVDDIVYFAGQQSNVAKYINAMDIFCLLSCGTEGFGNVNVEAQYLAKPVITTNIGGIPETVIKDKTAIIIPPRNVDELIVALTKLIENKDYATNMGKEGKIFVEQTFTTQVMINNLTKIYYGLLKN